MGFAIYAESNILNLFTWPKQETGLLSPLVDILPWKYQKKNQDIVKGWEPSGIMTSQVWLFNYNIWQMEQDLS